jgi:hypothetical protein
VKKTICLVCTFALLLAIWAMGRSEAASRCVPNKRLVVLSGGLVSDTLTNLVWQQQASSTTMTWALAKTYCPSGLRLPTGKELRSIVDFTVGPPGPTIDQTAFPGTPAERFWTSSPYVGASAYASAWVVLFSDGTSNYQDKSNSYRVRCVR